MNDSILPVAAQPVEFGYIQGALRRVEAMRSSEADPVEPPTLSELEETLGQTVRKCDLFAKNWRNRIYRIELANGDLVLGKQLVMGTDAMLRCQYEQLRILGALRVLGLRVPNTFALFPAKRLLLVEFVPGKTVESLFSRRFGSRHRCALDHRNKTGSTECICRRGYSHSISRLSVVPALFGI